MLPGRLFGLLLPLFALLLVTAATGPSARAATTPDNYFPADTFAIDRTPVSCGTIIFMYDKTLPVAGRNTDKGIIAMNPDILAGMPGVVKLYVASHECGYSILGRKDESAVACWAVRNGRDRGWFPPASFALLLRLLQQKEPGWPPPPDPATVAAMEKCYAQ